MNDHFWPSLHPGIIVALIIAVATGGAVAIVAGAIGGFAGSVAGYFLNEWFGLQETAVSLVILLAGASTGGYLGARTGARLAQRA